MNRAHVPEWLRALLGTDAARRSANHWVPLAYLKYFTDSGDSEGCFWLYDRERPFAPRRGVSPRVVARENLLYLLEGMEIPDAVERLLSLIEAPYPELRRRLIRSHRVGGFYADLSEMDLQSLAFFIAVQQGRTPYRRDVTNALMAIQTTVDVIGRLENVSGAQDELEVALGKRPTRGMISQDRADLEAGRLLVEPGEGHWMGHFLEVARVVATIIADLPYTIAEAVDGLCFPTSDHPVVVVRRERGTIDYELQGGWLEPTAEATITLDPDHVLVMGPLVDDRIVGSGDWCENVVRRTVEHSNRFVFAQRSDEFVSRVLQESEPPRTVLEIDGKDYDIIRAEREEILKAIRDSESPIVRFGAPRRKD